METRYCREAPAESRSRVLVVDDHRLVRRALAGLLIDWGKASTIAEAATGEEALSFLADNTIDLVLLDWALPNLHGAPLIRAILRMCPRTRILVLTMHDDLEVAKAAFAAGAAAYVTKGGGDEKVWVALNAILLGGSYVDPAVGGNRPSRPGLAPTDFLPG